jgi:hypothetical protein
MPVPVSYSSSSSILLGFRYANHMGKLAEVRIMASDLLLKIFHYCQLDQIPRNRQPAQLHTGRRMII